MARETKVGLLVGLAFIICFAIILANHGQKGAMIETLPVFAVNQKSKPALQPDRGIGKPAHKAVGETVAPDAQLTQGTPRPIPSRLDRDLSAPVSPLQMHHQGLPVENAPSGEDASTAEQIQMLQRQIEELLAQKNSENQDTSGHGTSPKELILTATPNSERTALHQFDVPPSKEEPKPQIRRHIVEKGDTLSGIAHRYYGSKSRSTLAMIVDANSKTIKDPNFIPLGVELVLPPDPTAGATAMTVNQLAPTAVAAPREGQTQATGPVNKNSKKEPPRERVEPDNKKEPFRWYQIKKNDRYVSIARQQLGDEGRWKEIFELNKEKFPQEGMIREGVRIKLPRSDGVADARGTKR